MEATQKQRRTPSGTRPAAARRLSANDNALKRPLVHDLTIRRMDTHGNAQGAIPSRVQLIRPNPLDPSLDQLFLDQMPVPRDSWRYDAQAHTLSWKGAYGGGHLHLGADQQSGVGNVGPALREVSVSAGATAIFDCDVALQCGATYESSGGTVRGFVWDPTSKAWTGAAWMVDRLQLSYTVTSGGPMQPPTFSFTFTDNVTEDVPWSPPAGSFAGSLALGQRGGRMVWNLAFKSSVQPPDDQAATAPPGPDSVYPYWLQAVEDASASSIDGVLLIDGDVNKGTLVGLRGVRHNALVAGYYRTTPAAAPFALFDGRLHIGGQPAGKSRQRGNELSWSDLSPQHQQRTGLPASGQLRFHADGSGAVNAEGKPAALRLAPSAAIDAVTEHADLHPDVHQRLSAVRQLSSDSTPDIYGLLAMTPYAQDSSGAWGDVVQAAVTQDLSDIMNSFIPGDLWNLLFPSIAQPTLQGELAVIAASPVPGETNPSGWYSTLATSVMTQGLANGSDSNCQYLNGPRAAAWLKTQVATSKVYYTHGQRLFQYEWQQRFPLTSQYLALQINNAAQYAPQITAQVQACVDDINQNVAQDSTQPNLKQQLIQQVQAVGQYALTNQLYWAFAYYTYNTSPAILANIALQMGINTGSSDGMTLSRLFQQNVSVLTALDPSGYFARQYTATINTFLATNILPNMFSFSGDAQSFDLIKLYLQNFVESNLHSEDAQIAAAAAQIQSILDDQQADKILQDSLEALRTLANASQDALALPFVANGFVKWFSTAYPRLSAVANVFGSLIIGGVTGLAVMNIITDCKNWKNLTDAQKAQLVTEASQIGLQIVAAVVKRGVRIYAIYGVEGMTAGQRLAAVSRIIATGEAERLDQGLVKIGSSTARWLADTEGTVGKVAVMDGGITTAVMVNDAATVAEEAGWVGRVLGKNLDEFIATRIGPVFILAGIGYSIYSISTGESGVALAGDILNLVSGALMLFATIGGWAVEGGLIAAEGLMATAISVAGPLAILAALAGLALMIYEMLQKPPDPVEEFVNDYAGPAGFRVGSKASSIDYAVQYNNPAGLLMTGFSLSTSASSLACDSTGAISIGNFTALPSNVWQARTDGLGMSQILTVAQPDTSKPPVVLFLSLMSDGSVSFQPAMPAPGTSSSSPNVTVRTQTWLSQPQGNATLTSDGKHLASLGLTLQPVLPDSQGKYAPAQASGWLSRNGSGVSINASAGTVFTLAMSGMAPNFMAMRDLSFLLGSTPSVAQSFGPTFGVYPSTPGTYALSPALPSFLSFDTSTGAIQPNGQTASSALSGTFTISLTNALGSARAQFGISVASVQAGLHAVLARAA